METQAENPSLNQETAALLRSNRELAVLYTIAGHLNRKIDVHEALQEVLVQVTNLLGLQTGWVWLLDQQGEPYLAAAQALPPYLADHPQRMTGYCLCLDTFLEGCLEGAANIDVFLAISKPSSHLHKRVIHSGSPKKVRNRQTF